MKTELDQIMRQKDDVVFANLLNEMRLKGKDSEVDDFQKELLQSRNDRRDEPEDALRVFATNKECDDYNSQSLLNLVTKHNAEIKIGAALDYVQKTNSNERSRKLNPTDDLESGNLATYLRLGIGARVMLIRNIDVNDGLVNGSFGTVVHITQAHPDEPFQSVNVKFDKERSGTNAAVKRGRLKGTVEIKPYEESLHGRRNTHITRRQIPLKLAWASTIHKVQGQTVDHIVVSLEHVRNAGQAYVAISRATTLDGLFIRGLRFESIFCDERIEEGLNALPKLQICDDASPEGKLTLLGHNVEGLLPHLGDLLNLLRRTTPDIIMLTETWLQEDVSDQVIDIKGYNLYRNDRNAPITRGGVAIYCKTSLKSKRIRFCSTNLEILGINVESAVGNIVCLLFYR